jgi:hypothetical protein
LHPQSDIDIIWEPFGQREQDVWKGSTMGRLFGESSTGDDVAGSLSLNHPDVRPPQNP